MTKQNLENHIKTVHEGIKKFKCDFCDYIFTWNTHRKDHMNRIHLGELSIDKTQFSNIKSFHCNICYHIFNKKQHLDRHSQTHDRFAVPNRTYTNYICDICDQFYDNNRRYTKHLKLTHDVACSKCDKYFTSQAHVLKHLENKVLKEQKKNKLNVTIVIKPLQLDLE